MNPRNHHHVMNEDPVHSGSLSFLRTELETGLTFVLLAEQGSDEDKVKRNRENARKACRSVRHFIHQISLSDSESAELHEKLKKLERRLRILEGAKK